MQSSSRQLSGVFLNVIMQCWDPSNQQWLRHHLTEHEHVQRYVLSCGRMISPLCRWSLRWTEGSWRTAGWSGSAWWTLRSSSCRSRWPERSCCQKTWSRKSEIYCSLTEGGLSTGTVFCGHKEVFLWRQTLTVAPWKGAKINDNICGEWRNVTVHSEISAASKQPIKCICLEL